MIKIAIIGYGNLGKACERIAAQSEEFEIAGIFTRRNPSNLSSPFGTKFFCQNDIFDFADGIDVACICTGSANDVTDLGVRLAKRFNTVDSFDTHAKMREYFADMDKNAKSAGKLSFVGIGWDPGLFSLVRALACAALPCGYTNTFWGRGVSQGHSEAIRRIDGVLDAKQYTVPKKEAVELARQGKGDALCDKDKHSRECYVAIKDGADAEDIARKIKTMPNYFESYDTTVNFVSEQELKKNHSEMPHAGFVLRTGETNGKRSKIEFSLQLESNPDFTASVLMAYARANAFLAGKGETGARTILDVPVSALFCGAQDLTGRFI